MPAGSRRDRRSRTGRAPAPARDRSGSRRHGRPRPSGAGCPSTICSTRGCARSSVLPRAGHVPDEAGIVRRELVVAAIVDAAERERRPEMIAFARVVVDDIEDDLDVRPHAASAIAALQVKDAVRLRPEIARLRREKGERRITPVILQALFDQEAVVGEGVDRQQLDGRDAELDEMLDRRPDGRAPHRYRASRSAMSRMQLRSSPLTCAS